MSRRQPLPTHCPLSPRAATAGPSLGRRRGPWQPGVGGGGGSPGWRGTGPRGCCEQVNNGSAHRAACSSAHQPRAGDVGVRLVPSPPFLCAGGAER